MVRTREMLLDDEVEGVRVVTNSCQIVSRHRRCPASSTAIVPLCFRLELTVRFVARRKRPQQFNGRECPPDYRHRKATELAKDH